MHRALHLLDPSLVNPMDSPVLWYILSFQWLVINLSRLK